MEKTLIYDSDCGFCTRSANWLAKGGKVRILPWQAIPDLSQFGLTEEMVIQAAYWQSGETPLPAAEAAIANALICRGAIWRIVGQFIMHPLIRPVAAYVYGIVARNRYAMPGGTSACRIKE